MYTYGGYARHGGGAFSGKDPTTEGSDGRIFEVTADHEIVWEYINPYKGSGEGPSMNMIYRAYRVPYEWIPQLEKQPEVEIKKIDVKNFRVNGSEPIGTLEETEVKGTKGYSQSHTFCVISKREA